MRPSLRLFKYSGISRFCGICRAGETNFQCKPQNYLDTLTSKHHLVRTESLLRHYINAAWGLIGRVDAYRPKGRGFDSRSRRHAGTLGKSFARSYLWRFHVKLRHSIHAMSGAPLSSSGLEEAL